jgi:hypothetical protein
MDASLETLIIAAYVFACSLFIPRCGPRGKVSDQELIASAVAQAVTGLVSDRQFLGTIGRLLPGCFPQLPGQPQFKRRLRRLTPQITRVQLGLAELIACGSLRLACGALLGGANYAGCASQSAFAGEGRLRLLRRQEPLVVGHAPAPHQRPPGGAARRRPAAGGRERA